jgi:hypothetical protein
MTRREMTEEGTAAKIAHYQASFHCLMPMKKPGSQDEKKYASVLPHLSERKLGYLHFMD